METGTTDTTSHVGRGVGVVVRIGIIIATLGVAIVAIRVTTGPDDVSDAESVEVSEINEGSIRLSETAFGYFYALVEVLQSVDPPGVVGPNDVAVPLDDYMNSLDGTALSNYGTTIYEDAISIAQMFFFLGGDWKKLTYSYPESPYLEAYSAKSRANFVFSDAWEAMSEAVSVTSVLERRLYLNRAMQLMSDAMVIDSAAMADLAESGRP